MELKLDGFSHKLPLLTVTVVQSLANFKVSLIVAKDKAYVVGATMLALLAGRGILSSLATLGSCFGQTIPCCTGG